jgi:MarR family transcriptional regulator for hemolysin
MPDKPDTERISSLTASRIPTFEQNPILALPYLMNRLTSRLNQVWRNAIRPCGLTNTRWQVLSVLSVFNGSRVGVIADLIGEEQPAVSRVIDQLVRDKLVERRPAKGDSRAVEVRITATGRKVYAQLLPAAEKYVHHLVAGFSTQETQMMLRLLDRLSLNVETAKGHIDETLEKNT